MSTTRRQFFSTAAAAGGLAGALPAFAADQPKVSPNDRVQIALIGCGGMGQGDCATALEDPGVELVAACDIYDGRLTHMKETAKNPIFTTRDYREVLARKDVDAVIIGTPDHWHARISIDAMNAGKDVYCEKPMVQKLEQGWPVIEAEKKTGRIFQVGSQRVSSIVYQKAQEIFKSGAIGQLTMVESVLDRNSAQGAWVYSIPPDASPDNIDWDRFLGSAPKVPFEPKRLFRWRNYQDYGTGIGGDLFVHLFSGIHFVLSSHGPTRMFSTGGLRYWKDGRDVPDVMLGLYDYPAAPSHPEFTLMLRVNFKAGAGEEHSFRFVGTEGVMTITDSVSLSKLPKETEPGYNIETFAKAQQDAFLKDYHKQYPVHEPTAATLRQQEEVVFRAPWRYSDHLAHHKVWMNAVRTRKPVIENSTFGFRAAAPALGSNVSYFEKRQVNWDPENMKEVRG